MKIIKGWDIQRLSDLGEIVTGNTPSKKQSHYFGGDVPWVKPGDLDKFEDIVKTEEYLSDEGAKHARILPSHSVLVSCIGNLGKVGVAGRPLATNQQINAIVFSEKIFPRYGYYACRRLQRIMEHHAPATTLPIITKTRFSELKIPVPPLSVQQKIASVLSTAESALEKRRQTLRLADDFLKSAFLEMFGEPSKNPRNWHIKTLDDVSVLRGQYGSGASAIVYDLGKPRYIRITDIDENGNLKDEKVSPSTNKNEWKDCILADGDILFARSGATVGKTYRFREKDGFCVFAGYLIRYRPDMKVLHPDYLYYFTKTDFYRKWILSKMKTVAQPNINAKQYGSEFRIPLPPIAAQQKFADLVQKVERLKEKQKQSETQLTSLFNSLMQRAFRGELT